MANEERRRIQHIDQRFKQKSSRRFQSKKAITRQGTTLRVDQLVTSDPNTILTEWERHFRGISASNEDEFPTLCAIKQQVEHLHIESQENEEMILDVPFCAEEVEAALKRLKPGKSAGHDMIDPEHIKYGGEILKIWIQQVCNAIVELEHVPESLKLGIVTPIYKGGGRDPLDTSSYRGITLTSVIAKILESLVLERLQVVLMEKGLPHPNQSAEAIFSTFEAISQFAQHGEMYLCFYDLQKAVDSVQYPILLKRLYDAGNNGKTWRLLRNWYHKPKSRVRGQLSPVYTLERGVLQGSVLAPTLFLLTLDPPLKMLEHNNLGPSIHGTYIGAFAHADDICTITSSLSSLQQQIHMLKIMLYL